MFINERLENGVWVVLSRHTQEVDRDAQYVRYVIGGVPDSDLRKGETNE